MRPSNRAGQIVHHPTLVLIYPLQTSGSLFLGSSSVGGSAAWAWRNYGGSNPHNKHIHISAKSDKGSYDAVSDWRLAAPAPELAAAAARRPGAVEIRSMSTPQPRLGLEMAAAVEVAPVRHLTPGSAGARGEASRSHRILVAKGKGEPMRRPAVRVGLESVIDTDERVRVLDTELAPWRMICALRMRGPGGGGAIGTGWLVGPRTILTAGHCVYSTQFFGGWAASVEISPGRNGAEFPYGTARSTRFSSVNQWVEQENPDFDIGCIHLDTPVHPGLGWFAVGALSPEELQGYYVNVSGYPSDRGRGTEQYHHKNRVLRVSDRRMFYDVDTYGGQSGAPVRVHESNDSPPLAIGVHAYGIGGSPGDLVANSAPRIIPEVLEEIKAWVEADGGWPGPT